MGTAFDYLCYYLISKNPIIIATPTPIRQELFPILQILRSKKIYCLVMPWHTFEDKNFFESEKKGFAEAKVINPNCEIIFLLNTEKEAEMVLADKMPGIFCNKNSLLDERIFLVKNEPKVYDAIYNARCAVFKNHLLAKGITRLAFITYYCSDEEKRYYNYLRRRIPRATWLNYENENYEYLGTDKVVEYLNKSRVGLCLSATEGSMYASCEYLLCGLPVVSVKSTGGRDIFFDDEYAKIVNSDPRSVAKGVREIIQKNVDPYFIRNKVLEKFKDHRGRFINAVQDIYDKEGIKKDFRKEWPNIFINKMLKIVLRKDLERLLRDQNLP